jgi:ethanolamine utilization protein EutA
MNTLRLVGIDVGSTTTSILVAEAHLIRNCVTGRSELGNVEIQFRPEPVFTPFRGETLDLEQLERQIECWLEAAALDPAAVDSGGALVTGLAARSSNAQAVTQFVKRRFENAVVAVADDPCLESWLAFMGNALRLSRAEPQRPFINLDIGGGTTNIAWGLAGDVRRCGCYYVGARHVQVEPGTYVVRSLSPFARALFADLDITEDVGRELKARNLAAVLDFYVGLLEAAVTGGSFPDGEAARLHCQAEFVPPTADRAGSTIAEPVITLSGGVGELAYARAGGGRLPGTTAFGDLGIDLAGRICDSPILGRHLTSHTPSGLGRATVQGLTIHSTEISGATLFLPNPEILPLADLPILGAFGPETSEPDLTAAMVLAARAAGGACLRVHFDVADTSAVKALGRRLAALFERQPFPSSRPLVLFASGNIGKTLGHYATRWGQIATSLIVIDEVPSRPAHFATIGRPHNGLVPVSFHGLEGRQ